MRTGKLLATVALLLLAVGSMGIKCSGTGPRDPDDRGDDDNNTNTGCGDVGEPCCEYDHCNYGGACGPGYNGEEACQEVAVNQCGGIGAHCCLPNSTGVTCTASDCDGTTCQPCGGEGQKCCKEGNVADCTCAPGFVSNGVSCEPIPP
jgi:hypothetical protein